MIKGAKIGDPAQVKIYGLRWVPGVIVADGGSSERVFTIVTDEGYTHAKPSEIRPLPQDAIARRAYRADGLVPGNNFVAYNGDTLTVERVSREGGDVIVKIVDRLVPMRFRPDMILREASTTLVGRVSHPDPETLVGLPVVMRNDGPDNGKTVGQVLSAERDGDFVRVTVRAEMPLPKPDLKWYSIAEQD